MPRSRLPLHRYTEGQKVEAGVVMPPAMEGIIVTPLSETSLRISDVRPSTSLPMRGVLRTCTPQAGGTALTHESLPGVRSHDFSGLTADTNYSLSSAFVDTSGRIGPAAVVLAKTKAVVIEPAPEQVGTLWTGDLTKALPGALGFKQVDTSAGRDLLASIVDSTALGGRAFRNVVPVRTLDTDDGYRALNELALVAAANFPRKSARLSRKIRFTAMGSVQSSPAKFGLGLAGAPSGVGMGRLSTGGNKYADSWTVRTVGLPKDYLKWRTEYSAGHPWCLGAYLYAVSAGGRTLVDYGLEFLYRKPDGTYITPVQGQVYQQDEEVVLNTPGVADGRFTVWIDGVQVLNLTDVKWNPSGYDIPVSYVLNGTFTNNPMSSEFVFDQGNPVLTEVATAGSTVVLEQDFTKMVAEENYITHATNEPYPLGKWPHVPWFLEPSSGTRSLDHLHIRSGRLVKSGNNTFHRMWTKKRLGGPGTSVRTRAVVASDVQPQTSSGTKPGLKMGFMIPGEKSIYPYDDPRGGSRMGGVNVAPASMQVFTNQTYEGYIEVSQQVFGGGYRFSWQHGTPAKKVGYVDLTENTIDVQIDWLEGNTATKVGVVRFRLWRDGTLLYDFTDTASPLWGYSGFWRVRTDDNLWKMKYIKIEEVKR